MERINWIKMTKKEEENLKEYERYLITYKHGKKYVGIGTYKKGIYDNTFRIAEHDLDISIKDVIAYVPIIPY